MRPSRRGFCSAATAWLAAPAFSANGPGPRVFVLLVAEQFRADYLDRYAARMGKGGFRRLISEGAWFPSCRMAASTFSSSGLATIATGAYPETHGIVADAWFDAGRRRVTNAAAQFTEGTTLAAEVLAANPRNRVIATGLDRLAPSLLAPDRQVYTLEPAGNAPEWLANFRAMYAPEKHHNARWQALGAATDAPPLRILTEDVSRPEEFRALYRASPFAQQAQLELLRVLLSPERLNVGEGLVLAIAVLSSMALLGYEVGADSPLMEEMVIHLDQQIEITLDALNRTPGPGNYGLIFTAAHGAPPAPDPARRGVLAITGEEVARRIDAALSAAYDAPKLKSRWVEKYVYPFLYLRHEPFQRVNLDLRAARRQAGQAALRVPGVAAYYTLDGECSRGGEWLRRFRNSFHHLRSGDLMLAYQPNCVEETGAGRGVSYGSLYNYDTQVPLIFYGGPFLEGVFEEAVESVDIAPTLARAMRVAAPSSSTGRVLGDALLPEPRG